MSKLAFAMLLLSVAFGILTVICFCHSAQGREINIFWLLPFYLIVALSELVLVPTVLSYISENLSSRAELSGLAIGFFLVSKGVGNFLSMNIAKAVCNCSPL